jgi:hypothetical protein
LTLSDFVSDTFADIRNLYEQLIWLDKHFIKAVTLSADKAQGYSDVDEYLR